ncbi:MAG: FAD-dependent oxidoreductase [Candidatus Omnitrophica bacterium]|nr:FAD-dependent oxidoreductase [Candidatus Omnitrophota bacterium]
MIIDSDKTQIQIIPIVIVIGGGFGGLSAVRKLRANRVRVKIILIDKKNTFDFLPALPDVISRRISSQFVQADLFKICKHLKCEFFQDEVIEISPESKQVQTSKNNFLFDYLVIASGSETNFYGNSGIKNTCVRLDSALDAVNISEKIASEQYNSVMVVGGGYTGVEVSSQVCEYFRKKGLNKKVFFLIRGNEPFQFLSPDQRVYARNNLEKTGVIILLNTQINNIIGNHTELNDGRIIDNVLVIWTAGVTPSFFIHKLNAAKDEQGRIKVAQDMSFAPQCFAVGDAAAFDVNGKSLRMAVHFAESGGRIAAENIINAIKGKPFKNHLPKDLGFVLPMANGFGCGIIFGCALAGRIPVFCHYVLCVFKSYGVNKWGILKDLLIPSAKRKMYA